MKRDLHLGLFIPFLLAILVASSMFPSVAQAEYHGTPWPHRTPFGTWGDSRSTATPTPQESASSPTVDPNATGDSPAPNEVASTPTPEAGSTDVTPAPTQDDSAPAFGAMEDGTTALTDETPVVVLDTDGNQVSLATNEAADIIAAGDPVWCPVGQVPGDSGCIVGSTVTALVAALASSSASGGGTVYFLATYSGSDAIFDGSTLSDLTDLTIQGGWTGGTGAGFALDGTTDFSNSLSIVDWNGDVTLNDLVFNNTSSDGVSVTTSGDIELSNVQSSGSSGRGAYLDNTSGGSGVQVDVSGSSFHNNTSTGLEIRTSGDVSLADVDASYNTGIGASILANGDTGVSQSTFSWNGLNGLTIDAAGDVGLYGADVRNNGITGSRVTSGGDLAVDSSSFDLNAGSGLDAQADNIITLTGVQANENDTAGLTLRAGRDVTLTDVEASQNGTQGAAVWADWNITVESSAFAENGGDGAYLYSLNRDISVDCSSFEDNGGYGVNADTHGLLDLSGDTFSGNDDGDYHITSGGTVTVGSSDNCPSGAETSPTATPTAILPLNVVSVVEGEAVTLDCTTSGGTVLVLPNGDQVILPCPITGDATLEQVLSQDLPGPLDPGLTFLSGMRLQVTPTLYGIVTVDFVIPFNQDVTNLSILRWDETGWTNLGGIRSGEIYFEARSSQDGVFVLVTK
jgi:hypothetical protein